ncbi:hypothetical protein [Dokdonella sp.]|uniref:hypothetical protein n=1 Tax=Dokdonella sp. TaxID=2291710 RepID=UPI001B03DBC0|nr:hypothetical protein [Dokdonella sp.]MBO9664811.1 hypothetical protein [Dokdonella sp.]
MIAQSLRRVGWRQWVWVVIGLALIVLMRKNMLSYDERLAPLPVHGALEQRVVGRTFAVTVKGFRLARSYKTAGGWVSRQQTLVLKTPGIWMSTVVSLEAFQQPVGAVSARVRAADGSYYTAGASDRPTVKGVNLTGEPVLPGLPQNGAYFFELPPAQLVGAHLEFFTAPHVPGSNDALVDIDLGLDKAKVDELVAKAPDEVSLLP